MRKRLLFCCLVLIFHVFVSTPLAVPTYAQGSDPQDAYVEAILEGLNDEREDAKIAPFVLHPALSEVAAKASESLLKKNQIPNTIWDDLQTAKYFYHSADAGAVSVSSNATPDDVVARVINAASRLWRNEELSEIGIGIAQDADWIAVLLIAAEPVDVSLTCDPAIQEEVQAVQLAQAETVLKLTNEARIKEGLTPLTLNPLLNEAARIYGEDMKLNGYPKIPHRGTDGSEPHDRVGRTGYNYIGVRENILMRHDLSAEGAFDQWWHSPLHKANILGEEVTEMGLAFTCNPKLNEFYYTQVFAVPFENISSNDYATEFATLVNELREKEGLAALRIDPKLMEIAATTSAYIAETRKYPDSMWTDIQIAGYSTDDVKVGSIFLVGKPAEALEYLLGKGDRAALIRGADWSSIGVGMTVKDDTYYLVYIFAKGVS
ncbi:MAG: hypothetical protein KF726_15245 [Anaerolineae bacterium]|nr:hypothetical protein [Anaerolineae bacterium]